MIYTLKYSSPLGGIVVACDGEALTGLWFEGQKYFGDTLPEQYEEKEAEKMPVLGEAKRFQAEIRASHHRWLWSI